MANGNGTSEQIACGKELAYFKEKNDRLKIFVDLENKKFKGVRPSNWAKRWQNANVDLTNISIVCLVREIIMCSLKFQSTTISQSVQAIFSFIKASC